MQKNSSNNSDSSIVSGFQFLNYKVDEFQIKNKHKLSSILNTLSPEDNWSISVSIRKPTLYQKDLICLGGLRLSLILSDMSIEEKDRNEGNALISSECSIVGLFKILNAQDFNENKKQYEDLMKYQIPAILLSFLRSAVVSFFANAGYGCFPFPLINILQVAQNQKIEIEYK